MNINMHWRIIRPPFCFAHHIGVRANWGDLRNCVWLIFGASLLIAKVRATNIKPPIFTLRHSNLDGAPQAIRAISSRPCSIRGWCFVVLVSFWETHNKKRVSGIIKADCIATNYILNHHDKLIKNCKYGWAQLHPQSLWFHCSIWISKLNMNINSFLNPQLWNALEPSLLEFH